MGEKFVLGVRRIEALIEQVNAKEKEAINHATAGRPSFHEAAIAELDKKGDIQKAIKLLEAYGGEVEWRVYNRDTEYSRAYRNAEKRLTLDNTELRKKYQEARNALWLADSLEEVQEIMKGL